MCAEPITYNPPDKNKESANEFQNIVDEINKPDPTAEKVKSMAHMYLLMYTKHFATESVLQIVT